MRDPAYGGGLFHRAQIFLNALITFARRRAFPCEIVVVEWNPVADAPRFHELLSWPKSLGQVTVRFIDVPAAVHERQPDAQRVPFMNTRARNVGVRRARGTSILVTGADVVPNRPLMDLLAHGRLAERAFYRIDRRDLSRDLPAGWPSAWQLALCRWQDVTVHTYYGSIRERRTWQPRALREIKERHEADPSHGRDRPWAPLIPHGLATGAMRPPPRSGPSSTNGCPRSFAGMAICQDPAPVSMSASGRT
jgi:hypothetical protein